jgi:hypothetical protein
MVEFCAGYLKTVYVWEFKAADRSFESGGLAIALTIESELPSAISTAPPLYR